MRYLLFVFGAAFTAIVPAFANDTIVPAKGTFASDTQAVNDQVGDEPPPAEAGGDVAYDESLAGNAQTTQSPWRFTFTQTVDYGTNLALPISLTPVNTLIAPLGNPGAVGILNPTLINQLGLGNALGLTPVVVPLTPAVAVFPNDMQFQTTAGLQHRNDVSTDGSLTTGYSYYQNLHPVVEQLDQSSHTLSSQYAHRLNDRLVAALDYGYVYYLLAEDTFVTQHQLNASLLWRQNEQWSWQTAAGYGNANFRQTGFLDSHNWSAKLEAIRYLEDPNDYLTFGYAAGYSDAAFRGFSYQVNNIYAGGLWMFGETNANQFRATAAYGVYDFFGADPIDNVARQDRILTLNALVARTLSSNWVVFGSYTWLNSESNVVRQIYDSSLLSGGVTYTR